MQVCREAGLYTESLMALQKLGKIAPTSPGLLEHMQKAAELCLGSGRFQGKQAQVGTATCKLALLLAEQSIALTQMIKHVCRAQSAPKPSIMQMPAC